MNPASGTALGCVFVAVGVRSLWLCRWAGGLFGLSPGKSLVAQMAKNVPAMQETRVRSLGREDPLKEGKATHSSILAWGISMGRGAWRATVHGVTESQLSDCSTVQGTWWGLGPFQWR